MAANLCDTSSVRSASEALSPVRLLGVLLAAFLMVAGPAASASAHPRSPRVGPAIDRPAGYVPQTTCQPAPKPGVVAFIRLLERTYPVSGSLGISRACNVGGTSEHKEGRAVDWAVKYSVKRQRRAASDAISWLLATDRYGNRFAMARRFGIMYLIWHRRIWEPWAGWKTYCVQRDGVCVSPRSGSVLNPHVNHVHFSFTWPGARKKVTYYHRSSTFVSSISGTPWGGYWLAGRNGQVMPYNAHWYGDESKKVPASPIVSITTTPDGGGYWLSDRSGDVKAYGDARYRGSRRKDPIRAGGFAAAPNGRGYWIFSTTGRVFAYGWADQRGGLAGENTRGVTAMMSTTTGKGYWLVTSGGRVVPFGDATRRGHPSGLSSPVASADDHFDDGYWLVTKTGRVMAFGEAHYQGGAAGKHLRSPVVGLTATADGEGYWLVTAKGRVLDFGSARNYGYPGHTASTLVTHFGACSNACRGAGVSEDIRD